MEEQKEKITTNMEKASAIVELFEDLLEEKGVEISCQDEVEQKERYDGGNKAKLYGTEYYDLVDKVQRLL